MNAYTDTSPIEAHWQTRAAKPWFSLADADAAASRILALCGMGTLLDVGCGNGTLMRALRPHGVDVHGIDRSPAAVALCNAQAPGCATLGDALSLPFDDGTFDTAVCCGLPDLLTEEDLHTLMAQLRRVARHGVVLMSTAPKTWSDIGLRAVDPDRTRRTFDHAAFEAGFRRHPLAMRDVSFAALEIDAAPRFMAYEPIPPAAAEFSARWLRERRDLHADHLRGTGRRADAHLARYTLACDHIRNADRVLDVACGMGYGARMLATASPAATVLGIDASPEAVAYSHANFGSSRVRFACDDAEKLNSLEGEQFDFITCFETLEHLPNPLALIERAHSLLSPGGRMLVSVPNDWADDSGKDPNPHHFHVYTRQRLAEEMGASFIIERTWRQSAGGGWKHSAAPRAITPAGDATDGAPAEWWLMLVMKTPVGAPKSSGDERLFPPQPTDPAYNLYQFARDYDNPALFRSIVCIGPRLCDPVELTRLSEQVLAAARPGSADHGAAASVLA